MSEIKKIHFGIVGLGNIASTHARAIHGHEEAALVVASSRSQKSRLAFVMLGSGSKISDEDENQKSGSGAADPMEGPGVQNHAARYKQIIQAIRNDKLPVVSGEESLQSLAVVESIYRSSELRKEVVVKDLILGYKT